MESGPMSSFPKKQNHFGNELGFAEKDCAQVFITFCWLPGELVIVKLSILGIGILVNYRSPS